MKPEEMKPYLDSLKDKNNILSGDTRLLPEPLLSLHKETERFQKKPLLPWDRIAWKKKQADAIRDYEVAMLSFEFEYKHRGDSGMELNKPDLSLTDDRLSPGSLHKKMATYLSSLKNPDDIMSGDYELLEGHIGSIYGYAQSRWDEAMEVVSSPYLTSEDKEPAKKASSEAWKEFHTAMRDIEVKLEEENLVNGSHKTNLSNHNLTQDTTMAKKTTQKQMKQDAAQANSDDVAENKVKMHKGEKSNAKNTGEYTSSSQSDADLQSAREPIKVAVKTEPQMVTVNGDKVSHGHIFESKTTPGNWFFSVRLNGEPLKSRLVSAEDLNAFQKKEIGIPQMMERYHPTKLMRRLSPDELAAGRTLSDGRTVDKFNFYKETDPQRPDFGKYKMYAQVGDAKMSVLAPKEALNSYFDKVATPAQLVEAHMGDKLHLKSAYERYSIPQGVSVADVSMVKEPNGAWALKAKINGEDVSPKTLSYDDYFSFFKTKTATGEQLVAKYFGDEIKQASSLEKGEALKAPLTSSLKM